MTKKLLRLNVVVTPAQHRLLAELGQLQGRSSASYLREMLDAAEPMLQEALTIWRATAEEAAAQPERLRAMLIEKLAGAAEDARQMDMIALMLRASTASNDAADAQTAPSGARASGASAQPSKRSRSR